MDINNLSSPSTNHASPPPPRLYARQQLFSPPLSIPLPSSPMTTLSPYYPTMSLSSSTSALPAPSINPLPHSANNMLSSSSPVVLLPDLSSSSSPGSPTRDSKEFRKVSIFLLGWVYCISCAHTIIIINTSSPLQIEEKGKTSIGERFKMLCQLWYHIYSWMAERSYRSSYVSYISPVYPIRIYPLILPTHYYPPLHLMRIVTYK